MFSVHIENGKMYLENCTKSNDLLIELLNSLIARMLGNVPGDPPIELVQKTSLRTMVRRIFVDEIKGSEESVVTQANKGEVIREEMMIFGESAMEDHQLIKEWLYRHIRRLSETSLQCSLEGVDSIAGLIECGRERAIAELIPKMEAHVTRIAAKKQMLQLADHGDANALYACYLDAFTLDYLKSFASTLNLRTSVNKDLLIASLANPQISTIEQFNGFVIDNDLRTGEACSTFQASSKPPSSRKSQTQVRNSSRTAIASELPATLDSTEWLLVAEMQPSPLGSIANATADHEESLNKRRRKKSI
jgi:hypothetical protein